jgi:cyclopropane fatty-acyl-phospholipid synthase-like methyltransferase
MRRCRSLFVPLLFLGCASAPERADHPRGHGHSHRFENADEWARRFDSPERDAWQRPDEVIRSLGLGPSDVVADIGAGTGYFAMRLAPHVARVIAADVEPDMVRYLRERAEKEGHANVSARLIPTDDPQLGEPVDVALIVNTVHHIEGRVAYFEKLRATLKPGGRIAVVDFKMGEIPVGPKEAMRVAPAALIAEMQAAGLALVTLDEALLPHQYVASFRDAAGES